MRLNDVAFSEPKIEQPLKTWDLLHCQALARTATKELVTQEMQWFKRRMVEGFACFY
jgi:hypothetical protein